MRAFNTLKALAIRSSLLVYLCALMLLVGTTIAAQEAVSPDVSHVREQMEQYGQSREAATTGFVPLNEMGARDFYKGQEGGLYGSGRNVPPDEHQAAAEQAAARIRPLDGDGNPADDGKIVLLGLGMSNTRMHFSAFQTMANADPQKSAHVVVVNAAAGGQDARVWAEPDGDYGRRVKNPATGQPGSPWDYAEAMLQAEGVTPQQVQAMWIYQALMGPHQYGEFPSHAEALAEYLGEIVREAKRRYPNLQLVFLSSRTYAGYASRQLNPEPYAYESAFAVRELIRKQMEGDPRYNYDASRGDVVAPVLVWGPYLWADGVVPRTSDGLVWERNDFTGPPDGTHPSASGARKVAAMLLEFFKTDPLAMNWFAQSEVISQEGPSREVPSRDGTTRETTARETIARTTVEGTDQATRCAIVLETGRVCALPDDNLIQNPWFRTGSRPSLDGWTVVRSHSGGWEPSQKPGNPTPDEMVGTAARLSTGRGASRSGRTIDPNEFTSLVQVVAADPTHSVLKFSMYWVAHTVDPVVVTVHGGPTPEGPWSLVWTPFYQRHTQVIRPESGRGNDLWGYYTALTPPVSTRLEQGYPYYKLQITASLPDQAGGLKITGVYFSTAGGTLAQVASRPAPREERMAGLARGPLVPGSSDTVEIVRDTWGVAHVFADTDAGAFFGAGFATAQDRMLQMELSRRAAAGRLSEILGSDWVEHDKRVRIIGLHRHAERVAEHLPRETREALEAYAVGVNHFLNTEGKHLVLASPEHRWTPEPWTAADSIAVWMRLSEFFDRSWEKELDSLRNYEARAERGAEAGFRVLDEEAAVVTETDFALTNPEAYRRLKALPSRARTQGDAWEGLKASHAWAVSGERTVTGAPLLESDPQLPVILPSVWYEIHLQGASFNARGIGVEGAPGFLVGWNEHLAWGATALGSDNADLFRERLDATGNAYAYQSEWLPLETRVERVDVLGSEPVYISVRETQHGPLVDDLLPGRGRDEHFALHYVVTQELHTSIDGLLALMRATDWESFKEGLSRYHSPGLHIVYADVHGNIGYHTAAAIPIRQGAYGLPQVGWTGEEEWAGYVPFAELPQSLNPERGFVASANHLPVGDWYPYNLTVATSGHNPRSLRLYELLSERDDFSVDVFEQEVHRDNISPVARDFVYLANRLNGRNLLTPQAARLLEAFAGWDGRMIEGDAQSQLGELLLSTMHRSLGNMPGTQRLAARFGGGFPGIIHLFRVVLAEHEQSDASEWDTDVAKWISAILEEVGPQMRRPAARERRPELERMPYQTNLERFGSLDPAGDRVRPDLTTTFVDTIWSQAGNSYTHIVDLSDIDNSRAFLPPGISELPNSPHYFDQADLWVQGGTRPAPLSRTAVMEHAESIQRINVPF